MASYSGKAVVTSAKITFAGTAYDCKSIPSGIPETCEPPNVTVLTDTEQRFESAAVTEDGESRPSHEGRELKRCSFRFSFRFGVAPHTRGVN